MLIKSRKSYSRKKSLKSLNLRCFCEYRNSRCAGAATKNLSERPETQRVPSKLHVGVLLIEITR